MPTLYDINGCYSEDTEVLTRRGWLQHSEISLDDDVACFDPETETLTYARPLRIIRKPFTGRAHRYSGYGYDLLVTPEHRMLLKPGWPGAKTDGGRGRPIKWPAGKWSFCESSSVPAARFKLPLAAPLRDAPLSRVDPAVAALAGWYVSEGGVQSSGVSICQAEGPRAREISGLLTTLQIPFRERLNGPGGKGGTLPISTFYIGVRGARETVAWLRRECGEGSASKRIPQEILEGQPQAKEAFLAAYLSGDGSTVDGEYFKASTTSRALVDDLQRLALELGRACSWSEIAKADPKHAPAWQINIGRSSRAEVAMQADRNKSTEFYGGYVWCLEVPTGAYVTRRNGAAVICGNSANWYNKADLGVIVHRGNETDTLIKVQKSRYHEIIGTPGEIMTHYSRDRRKFIETERIA